VSTADAAILRGVAAALTSPSGTILHEQALVTVAGQQPARFELWQQADSPYAYRVIKFGHEGSWNGSRFSDFDAASNTIAVQPESGSPSGRGAPGDLAATIRSLVESGQAKIDEETTFDGVAAYKLTVSGADQPYLNGTVFVARSDYRPLEIETTQAGRAGDVAETVVFQTYEHLPANQANLRLLDLAAQHPGARVVSEETGAATSSK
jgi:hypothetical protein